MEKKVLKAAVANLRGELRKHGGKKFLPEDEKPAVAVEVKTPADDEDEEKEPKKGGAKVGG